MGNDDCQVAEGESVPLEVTPTSSTPMTASAVPVPTATPKLSEPDPTRDPLIVATSMPTEVTEMKTLRIKVIVSGKESAEGIQVAVYDLKGNYVTDGRTDDKGNADLSMADGSYNVATLYEGVWQKDGPFSTGSKENVIHR
jgi:hypothetical protein